MALSTATDWFGREISLAARPGVGARRNPPFLLFVVLLLALGGCQEEPPPKVIIGVAVPLSGPLGPDGQGILRAVELAVEEAREAGLPGIVEVRSLDDGADSEQAVRIASLFSNDPAVIAVVGHLTSGCSIPAARVYAGSGLAMITPSATNPELTLQQTKPDWKGPRVVFRVPPSDAVQGAYSAAYAYGRLGLRRILVVHDQTPYGHGLAIEFSKAFEAKGGEIPVIEPIRRGDTDFRPILRELKKFSPDGIFFGGIYREAGLILRQAREVGFDVAFFSGDGAKTRDLFTIAGSAVDGAYFTVSGVPVEHLPSAEPFRERYKARYPEKGMELRTFDHYGYEAALIVLEAYRKAVGSG